ncbi:MAG: EVE domain-containing protein [Gulosibacter sp.]|uniref:EVE domain-containing protein n=1 Tax=Gulosibacter sp. TaxID=2817531 RepID=UPI003F91653D
MAIRYWLMVHPLDRARELIEGGYAQVAWGGPEPLDRMRVADGVILYCPRESNPDGEPLRAAVQAGRVTSEAPYQPGTAGRSPWRVNVEWLPDARFAFIRPLRDLLELTRDSKFWGEKLRPGWVEISRRDFEIFEDAVRRPSPNPSAFMLRALRDGDAAGGAGLAGDDPDGLDRDRPRLIR